MIGCLWTRVHKRPLTALYFEYENELMFNTSRPDPQRIPPKHIQPVQETKIKQSLPKASTISTQEYHKQVE